MLSILFAFAAHATCPEPFVFQGQPSCVSLSYAEGRTVLENRCEHPVWLDQSVRLPKDPSGPVPAKATVTIRDLNVFTLGMGGELFQAVATLAPECVEPAPLQVAKQ
mgnify:CR=1 FL=1|jgi:hypothetical protein